MDKAAARKILESSESLEMIFPNGATSDQLTRFGWLIYSRDDKCRVYTTWKDVPANVKRLDTEKYAWDMMISCHSYYSLNYFYEEYYQRYLEEYKSLGGDENVFMACMKVQEKALSAVNVRYGIHTDGEGNIYNGTDQKAGDVIGLVLAS